MIVSDNENDQLALHSLCSCIKIATERDVFVHLYSSHVLVGSEQELMKSFKHRKLTINCHSKMLGRCLHPKGADSMAQGPV